MRWRFLGHLKPVHQVLWLAGERACLKLGRKERGNSWAKWYYINETGRLCRQFRAAPKHPFKSPIFSSYMVCPHWSENSMPCLLWEVSHIGTNQEIFRSPPTNPTKKKWWIGRIVRSISWNKFARSAPPCAGGAKNVTYILRKLWLEFWKSTEFCPTMSSPYSPLWRGLTPHHWR